MDLRRIEVIDDEVAAMLRQKSPSERVAMALDANRTIRQMLEMHFGSRHPDWSGQQIAEAVARRMFGGTG